MISGFFGFYRPFSNFHYIPIEMDGIVYPTTEHAYQAAKTDDVDARRDICCLSSPALARKAGQKVQMRKDWDDVKLSVMRDVSWTKYQDEALADLLLSTGDLELVEDNRWGDKYWGRVKGVGENNLGKILMDIRTRLRVA